MARENQTIPSDSGAATLLATVPWQHEKAIPLLKNVLRLTAPNPGMMTGPGTNSYIIGTMDTGYIVVDPGPNDTAHIQRLFEATQGDIRMIVCTHSHADHSPGAKPLQALCPSHPQIYGLPSGVHASSNAYFVPDKTLQNKEQLRLVSRRLEADLEVDLEHKLATTIEVIFTPGHAENHVCLALVEDGLLLSGDHILNGSTTVIDPPDGDMTTYLQSLDTLAALCTTHQADFILPAHGYVLTRCLGADHTDGARRAIEELKAHRLRREAKVMQAMRTKPGASVQDLLPLAYDDVPPKLWPVAARSLTAHMQRIEALSLL